MKQLAYWQKLQDPRWQKKRLEVFDRDGFACRSCNSKTDTLQVHHLYYISKREPWEYPLGAFKTLCVDCHKAILSGDQSENWEFLVAIENDIDLNSGGFNFSTSLIHFSHSVGWSDFEVMMAFSEVMDEGLINADTLSDWKSKIRDKRHKEAELLMESKV